MSYVVYYFNPTSPQELQDWLNEMYIKERLKLIAIDNGYYIFEAL